MLSAQNNYAQNFPDLKFSLLAPVNDLPAGLVTVVFKDSRGLLWIGTENKGLLRYDGKKIKSYHSNNNTGNAISSNYINNICEDKQGCLWIGAFPGLYHLDPVTDRIETFLHNENDSNSVATNNKPIPFVDSKGRVWISSNKGLQLFNTSTRKFSSYTIPPVSNPAWQLHATAIGDIYEDKDKNLWAESAYGLYLIDTNRHSCIPYFTGHYIYVTGILQDSKGQLWVSFWGGGIKKFYPETGKYIDFFNPGSIVKFMCELEDDQHKKWICFSEEYFTLLDPITGQYKYYYNDNVTGKIKGYSSNHIYKDNENRLWIMTNDGINIMDPKLQSFKNHSLTPAINKFNLNISNMGIPNSLLKTVDGFLVSCWYNGFLYSLDQDWNVKKVIKKLSPLSSSDYPRINTMQYDDEGNTWYGTDSCLIKQSVNNRIQYFLPTDSFSSIDDRYAAGNILKRPDGLYWSRFTDRGLYVFDALKGTFYKNYRNQYSGYANSMEYDREGTLWLGTSSGLYRYNKNADSFALVSFYKTKTIYNQFYNYIHDIYFDKDNTGWIATYYGVVKLSVKDKQIDFITDPQMPARYAAEKLLEDSCGTIWILSDGGIHTYNKKTKKFRYFTSEDGLPENFRGAIALFNWANDSTIAAGTLNTIITFNPYKLNNNQTHAPIIFTDIIIDEERYITEAGYNKDAHIIAAPGTKKISIHFAFPNYSIPQQNRLYYRISGEWIETKDGDINLLDLPAGEYKLEVKAGSNGSIVSYTYTSVSIIVKPFWYQTILLKIIYVLTFASALYFFMRWRIRSVKSAAALKQQMTETEMAALKAQMNPHFMFNCINSIDAFIHSNDKYNATLYLNKFAKLLRNILDSSKQNAVAFTKDIETLKLYIELEELRNDNKFKTTIDIDNVLMDSDYKVPPLIIQPFVENAILHGLKNKDGNDGLLEIEIKKLGDKIEYAIKDNGIGRKAAGLIVQNKESSYGMQLSYDRIRLFNKEPEASVKVTDLYEDNNATGTLIKVELKII